VFAAGFLELAAVGATTLLVGGAEGGFGSGFVASNNLRAGLGSGLRLWGFRHPGEGHQGNYEEA
jgi:hypothetical protein